MRTLSATLLTAQQGTLLRPYVSVTRRRCSAWEDRYTPVAGPAGPGTQAAVCAGGGKLTAAYLTGGSLWQLQYSGTPPAAGSARQIATTADTLVAAAQNGSTIAIVTATRGQWTLSVRISTDGGTSYGSAETVSLSGLAADAIQALACGWNAAGTKLLIATEGQSRIACTLRTGPGTFAAAVYSADGFSFGTDGAAVAPGIATAYSKPSGTGDWIVFASYYISSLYTVNCYVFGDGDTTTAGTLTARQALISVQPYVVATSSPGSALAVVGAALTLDTVRCTTLENTKNPLTGLSSFRNYQVSCQSAALAKVGACREPQALFLDSSQPLLPAFDPSTQVLYYVNASSVYYAVAPTTQDLSARVLKAARVESENGGHVSIILDDADGSLTSLVTADLAGDKVTLDFGYVTSAGNEVAAGTPLWVGAAHVTSSAGLRTVELQCYDAWHLLANWRPRRLYSWITGQSTILQIIQWICARAGLPFVSPGSPSTLLQTSPAFNIRPGDSGAVALHALLDQVPEVLWWTAQGATLRNPQPNDATVYSYTTSSHPIQTARLSTYPRSLNHVLLFGKANASATAPSLLAEAFDTADTLRIHDQPHIVHDMQLAAANALVRAAAVLRKAQILIDTGEIAAAPNAGLEVWDPIAVTYAGLGLSAAPFRVREIDTSYSALADGGEYTQSVGLMNV